VSDDQVNVSVPKTFKPQKIIFGKSPQSVSLMHQVIWLLPPITLLLYMEKVERGKKLFAQIIHQKSARSKQSFVAMDCGLQFSKELAEVNYSDMRKVHLPGHF